MLTFALTSRRASRESEYGDEALLVELIKRTIPNVSVAIYQGDRLEIYASRPSQFPQRISSLPVTYRTFEPKC